MSPPSQRDSVVERIHGVEVADPFRWLEKAETPEARAWTERQNARTSSSLGAWPGRPSLRRRLEALMGTASLGPAVARGSRLFPTRREGRLNQPILLVRDNPSGPDRVLLDPNVLSEDGTAALDWYYPSREGELVAYGLSTGGSELSILRLLDVASGRHLEDRISRTRACSLAWEPSGRGFYYTRYPAPGTVPAGQEMYHRRVFHHRVGDDPAQDRSVFGEGRPFDRWPDVVLSPRGRWLVVMESEGWTRTRLYLADLDLESEWVSLAEDVEALYSILPLDDRLLIRTNDGAPAWRLMEADPASPERRAWRELIPEAPDALERIEVAGRRILAAYLKQACSALQVHGLDGSPQGEIPLPPHGTIFGLDGENEGDDLYVGWTSFTAPPRIYRYQIPARSLSVWERVESPIDEDDFTTEQIQATSRDGTRIPIFVIYRKGLIRDGSHPALLSGYGGFSIAVTPAFERESFLWLEQGGILAVSNLRGGGEFGEAWHQAGMLGRKQSVFDDFIAAAGHLIGGGYTRPDRLAIRGGSNGGLLVGAALTQRPDLFRAAVCRVPLLDMIRYHHFRIARLWIPEYGSADDPEQFRWLIEYSPYHRVKDGTVYPAVLLTTAESDSRVDPMHAMKMAARLQEAQAASDRPILLRVESRAGHGAGKPLNKQIDEQVDIWTFLFRELGVDPPAQQDPDSVFSQQPAS